MPVTFEQAIDLVRASHARAAELELCVSVAVVDEGGLLLALGRMDGAAPISAQIAEAKASGAAVWQRDGDRLAVLEDQRAGLFRSVDRLTRLPLVPAAGSLVLREAERVIGAIGVSGAKSEEDRACAESAIATVLGERA